MPTSEHEQTDLIAEIIPEKTIEVRDLTPKQWETYKLRKLVLERIEVYGGSVIHYLRDLETNKYERGIVGLKDDEKVWNEATVFAWKSKSNDIVALARTVGGVGRIGTLPNWTICFTLDYLEFKPRGEIKDIVRSLGDFGNEFGYAIPSYGKVGRFVRAIKSYGGIQHMMEAVKKRKYHSQYTMSLRNVRTYSNQYWQTDATHLPIWLLSENGKKPYQPWLLLTIDCFSGLPMGWTIPDWKFHEKEEGVLRGNDADTNDVISHLKSCMLQKSETAFWGGKPTYLQSDNGAIYRAQNLQDVADELRINMRHSPPYCPSANGGIERLNQTVKKEFAAKFTEFLTRRKTYSSQKQLFVGTLVDLRRHFDDFIIEYANTHRRNGNKDTVLAHWHANLRTPDEAFANHDEVESKCLHYGRFPVTREGILIRGVHFRDADGFLRPSRKGKKDAMVLVRYNPDGEPKVAIARIGHRDVTLIRNIKAEVEMMNLCKNAQAATKRDLLELGDAIRESSVQTAQHHSPYAVENLTNPPPETPLPTKMPGKIHIPKFTKYQVK